MPELPAHTVEKHTEFFFPDGNIVLAAGKDPTLAFRLHKGIVSRWSTVFRRMLDTLETLSDPFTFLSYDVLMFDDDPVDFERLIRVLCYGTASVDCSPTNFPVLASILQLSHKYRITHLQDHTMGHLIAAYPLTLSGWDTREAYAFSPSARRDRLGSIRDQRPHPLEVVSLALRVGAPQVLVPVYLDIARFPVSEIIRGYTLVPSTTSNTPNSSSDRRTTAPSIPSISTLDRPTIHLPVLQTTAVLRGKEILQHYVADFINVSVENRVQSPLCRYIHIQHPHDPVATPENPCVAAFARLSHELLVMAAGVSGGVDSDPLFVMKCAVEILKEGTSQVDNSVTKLGADDAPAAIEVSNSDLLESGNGQNREEHTREACVACIESFKQTVDLTRQHVWSHLPTWFDLRKFIENGFAEGWE
ncbi:hypothetical protein JB92DRAFT_1147279 [Gautieria morchelliformis]|nr:hypothetical protein JB92DRAFT_1147279 [Gautieria morchelliformis]